MRNATPPDVAHPNHRLAVHDAVTPPRSSRRGLDTAVRRFAAPVSDASAAVTAAVTRQPALDARTRAPSRRARVLLVSPFYAPGIGGSSRMLREIVEHLNATGYETDVLTYDWVRNSHRDFDAAQPYAIRRTPFRRIPGSTSLGMFAAILSMHRQRRYALLFCGVAYPTILLAHAASLLTRVPYIAYAHGEDVTATQRRRWQQRLLRRAASSARAVMVNSSFTSASLRQLPVAAGTIVERPPWINPERFAAVTAADVARLRTELGLSGRRVMLTVARLEQRKGQDTIIRALPRILAAVPDAHYVIVGQGEAATLRALAETCGVGDRVTILTNVGDRDLPAYFHLCDVHALVSRWDPASQQVEGFGVVYLEAAVCGKASVGGTSGGCADAVVDGQTGILVDPESVEEVAAALTHLLQDRERAAVLGAAGRERVLAWFTARTALADVVAVVQRAMRRPRRAGTWP